MKTKAHLVFPEEILNAVDEVAGKRNEPSYVRYTAQKVAEIKKVPFEKVAEVTTENAVRVFRLIHKN